jgi:hypothetical protein
MNSSDIACCWECQTNRCDCAHSYQHSDWNCMSPLMEIEQLLVYHSSLFALDREESQIESRNLVFSGYGHAYVL